MHFLSRRIWFPNLVYKAVLVYSPSWGRGTWLVGRRADVLDTPHPEPLAPQPTVPARPPSPTRAPTTPFTKLILYPNTALHCNVCFRAVVVIPVFKQIPNFGSTCSCVDIDTIGALFDFLNYLSSKSWIYVLLPSLPYGAEASLGDRGFRANSLPASS
jgi:hypothetical protein